MTNLSDQFHVDVGKSFSFLFELWVKVFPSWAHGALCPKDAAINMHALQETDRR